MTGTLKARVSGAWVPILGGGPVASAGNSLGIVAMGAGVASGNLALPINTATKVTQDLPFTMQVGRRYRVHIGLRAFTVAANGAVSSINVTLKKNGTAVPTSASIWLSANGVVGQYTFFTYDWIFDGDGVAGTWSVDATPGNAAASTYPSDQTYFYIEDVGPNMYPALSVAATPPPWTLHTMTSPWVAEPSFQAPRYRKIGDVVYVEGSCNRTAGAGSPFTFPAGFRPAVDQRVGLFGLRTGVGGVYVCRCQLFANNGFFNVNEISPVLAGGDLTLFTNFQFSTTA